MKKTISKLLIVGMLLVPLAAVTTSTGCTLTTQQNAVVVEYTTLKDVITVVDVARGVYDELYKAGKVSATLDLKVSSVYTEYQRVGNLALSTAKSQAALVNSGVVPGADTSNPYVQELQNLVNGLIDLFNTAQPAGQPLTAHLLITKNPKP